MPTKKEKHPLSVTHPDLAKEAVGWDPSEFSAGSNKKKLWRCQVGHEWEALISNRSRGRGCKKCSDVSNAERQTGKKINTMQFLVDTHPLIAAEIVGLSKVELKSVKTNSAKKFTWRCSKGHNYPNTPNNRTKGQGCPYCSGRSVLIGFNDLETTHPTLAAQASGWNPKTISYGMSKRLLWKCSFGHTWKAIVNLRSSQDTECPVCTGKIVLEGFNDLATTHPEIAKQANGWDPKKFTFGSQQQVDWICPEGHKWRTAIGNRTPSYEFKPSKKQKSSTEDSSNEFSSSLRIAELISVLNNFKNRENAKVKALELEPVQGQIPVMDIETSRGSGCPSCAVSGFDPNSEGWLYFLTHPKWQMLQIGITNFPEDRLKSHKKLGWVLIELRGPMDGLIARDWETSILQMLKGVGADLSNESIAGKFDGYTEAWSRSTFEVKSIKELMRRTEEYEEL